MIAIDLPNPPRVNDGRSVEALVAIAVPRRREPVHCLGRGAPGRGMSSLGTLRSSPGSVDRLVQLWVDLELVGVA